MKQSVDGKKKIGEQWSKKIKYFDFCMKRVELLNKYIVGGLYNKVIAIV